MSIDPQRRALLRRIGGLSRRLRQASLTVVVLTPFGWLVRAAVAGQIPGVGFPATAFGLGLLFHFLSRARRPPQRVLDLASAFSVGVGLVIASGLYWLHPAPGAAVTPDRVEFPLLLAALSLPSVAAFLPTTVFRQILIGASWTLFLRVGLLIGGVTDVRASDVTVAMTVATAVSAWVVWMQNDQTRREAENRLRFRRANRERKQALRARNDLIANLSHDIRNPLAVAIGYATMTADEDLTPSERAQSMTRLQASLWQLTSLVENVLVSSADEAGALQLSRERVSVSAMVVDAGEGARVLLRGRPVELLLDVEPGIEVIADRQRLQRILDNLIGNAVKYTERGRIRLVVRADGDSTALIEVEDTGVGIPEEKLARVFDRFEQLGDARREGVGLGLSIARLLTERMGGSLAVRSRWHEGSCFSVRLPLSARAAAPAATSISAVEAAVAANHHAPARLGGKTAA